MAPYGARQRRLKRRDYSAAEVYLHSPTVYQAPLIVIILSLCWVEFRLLLAALHINNLNIWDDILDIFKIVQSCHTFYGILKLMVPGLNTRKI